MNLEELVFVGDRITRKSDGKKVKVTPIEHSIVIEQDGDSNTFAPDFQEVLKKLPTGANAYTISKKRSVIIPGMKYGFAVQYDRI